mgnify:CR=1 FL=1
MSDETIGFVSLNPDYPDQFHITEKDGEPCIAVPHWAITDLSAEALMIVSYITILQEESESGKVSIDEVERRIGNRMPGFMFGSCCRGLLDLGIIL